MKAIDFLNKAVLLQEERGKEHSGTKEERSFSRVATAFNAITGKNLTAAEVTLLLQILKDVRQFGMDRYHQDSIEDCVAYAALKAEELSIQYNIDPYKDLQF